MKYNQNIEIGEKQKKGLITSPVQKTCTLLARPEEYPYVFDVDAISMYIGNPVIINQELVTKPDVFQNYKHPKQWGWLVRQTSQISEHDFMLLTRKS